MSLRKCFAPESVLFIAIWLILMVGGQSRFLRDPGTFWHTTTGDLIRAQGFIDRDPYTFTFHDEPWIPYQWLGEVGFSLVHQAGGFDLLLWAAVTFVAGMLTWLAVLMMRGGIHWSLTALFLAGTLAASAGHFHVRPHLMTMLLMGLLYRWLVRYEADELALSGLFLRLPVLFVLWTNIHGGMLGGLATLGIAIVLWMVQKVVFGDGPIVGAKTVAGLLLLVAVCGATMFVNPYGIRLPQTWKTIMTSPSLSSIIVEHMPPDFHDPSTWLIVMFGAVYLGLLTQVRSGQFRVVWLLPLVWLALTLTRVRHAPLFAIAATVAIADLFGRTRIAERMLRSGSDMFTPPVDRPRETHRWLCWILPAILIAGSAGLKVAKIEAPVVGSGWARFDPKDWPLGFTDEIERIADETPRRVRMFDEYGFGGWLIYHHPRCDVFVDDRCELFGDSFLKFFVRTSDPGITTIPEVIETVQGWERAYGEFDAALVASEGNFDRALAVTTGWREVKRSGIAVLYVRVR